MCGCKSGKCRQTVVAPCDQATWLTGSSIWSPQQRPTQTNSLNRKTEQAGRKSRAGECGGSRVGGWRGGCCEWPGSLQQERARSLVSFVCAQELTLPRINPLPSFLSLFVFTPLFSFHNQHQTSWRRWRGRDMAFIYPIRYFTNNLSVALRWS